MCQKSPLQCQLTFLYTLYEPHSPPPPPIAIPNTHRIVFPNTFLRVCYLTFTVKVEVTLSLCILQTLDIYVIT
jgi:hypothetical protein